MRLGVVVNVRLSPADTMSAVDIIKQANAFFPGMSISAACALAMSVAFEELRKQGKIPRREGFEYGEMLADFPSNGKNNKTKRAIANRIYQSTVAGAQVSLDTPTIRDNSGLTDEEIIARQMEELEREGR